MYSKGFLCNSQEMEVVEKRLASVLARLSIEKTKNYNKKQKELK